MAVTINFRQIHIIIYKAINNSYVQAELNWWGTSPPQSSSFYTASGASIDYTPWLTSPPGGAMLISGTPETDFFENDFSAMENNAGESSGYMDNFNPKWPLGRQLVFARDIMWLGDIESSQTICKNIIGSFPDSSLSFFALDILWQSSRKAQNGSTYDLGAFKQYVHDLSVTKEKKELYGYSVLLSAGLEEEKSLISASDKVHTKYEGTFLAKIALYKKFSYYFNEQNDFTKAKETADQLQHEFPNSEEAGSALSHFEEGQPLMAKSVLSDNLDTGRQTGIPTKYGLSSNYPNPFNPSTSVEFSLPKESKVDIAVYNSLGQFVNRVSFNSLPAGFHTYKWEGKNDKQDALPSGLYLLRFTAQSLTEEREVFNKSIKMLLIR